MEFVLEEKQLAAWVAAIMEKNRVIGIQAKGDKFDYAELEEADALRLDFDVSLSPPKKYFLLPEETLFHFNGIQMQGEKPGKPFVLFGVHPYDIVALRQLDKLFEQNNPDRRYSDRRDSTVIVAVDVENPSENVFSGYLGFSHVEDGYDLLLTKIGKVYLVQAKTEKGGKLVGLYAGFTKASKTDLEKREKIWAENKKKLRKHQLKAKPEEIAGLLEKAYDHKIWKEKARLCFSCGSCNLCCPTCYCFDVADVLDWSLQSGRRVRTWDGCMLEPFALVAGDHNFRKQKEERYRHRYYRKGKYVPEKIGEFSCVGCGRCIGACVAHIANPVEVYNAIMEG